MRRILCQSQDVVESSLESHFEMQSKLVYRFGQEVRMSATAESRRWNATAEFTGMLDPIRVI